MLALLAAATVASAAALPLEAGPLRDASAQTVCKPNGRYQVSDPALLYRRDGKALAHRLGDLPRPNHEKAVLRTVDGCASPAVVGYRVGP